MKTLLLILLISPTFIVGQNGDDADNANATGWIIKKAEDFLPQPVAMNLTVAEMFLGYIFNHTHSDLFNYNTSESDEETDVTPKLIPYFGRAVNAVPKSAGIAISNSGESRMQLKISEHYTLLSVLAMGLVATCLWAV